ncbi:MAG: GNAT family N-acetyltransferase, partial [Deltaproteobacteria bacterium]|nr:GNAT family N-acetyltransferase [Deltaproteobacteria bacterium]
GEIAGFLDLRRSRLERCAHTAELGLGIAKPYRGLGIGKAMINYSLDWAGKNSISKVKLGVIASNTGAHSLYERLGFAECGRHRKEVKIDGAFEDLILMEKELISYDS